MEKEIDLQKIYDETWNAFNQLAGIGAPMANSETIATTAMKRAAELALDLAAEEALADVETGVKTTLCDMCPEYDAVVNKQSILALKTRIK